MTVEGVCFNCRLYRRDHLVTFDRLSNCNGFNALFNESPKPGFPAFKLVRRGCLVDIQRSIFIIRYSEPSTFSIRYSLFDIFNCRHSAFNIHYSIFQTFDIQCSLFIIRYSQLHTRQHSTDMLSQVPHERELQVYIPAVAELC